MSARTWTFLSACFALGTPLFLGLLNSFGSPNASFFLVSFLALVGYLIAGCACVGIATAAAFKGRWGTVFQCAIVPAAIATFVAFPGS
jgi:hypothetical protein